jgi:hypothetical protein
VRVFVYWNLHRKCWSVRAEQGPDKGRVIAHTDHLTLANVQFRVSEAGRQRVLREGRKNVHAGCVGEWCRGGYIEPVEGDTRVRYSPQEGPHFYRETRTPWGPTGGRAPLDAAALVSLTEAGRCYRIEGIEDVTLGAAA